MLKQLSGVDRYRRLDEGAGLGAVARGSYGNVYIAIDRDSSGTVAVKRQEMPSNAAAKELAYYKALSQYPHPNVMALLDHFTLNSKKQSLLYMVFDVMDGDLWHVWKGHRRLLPLADSKRYLQQLVNGVAHLHGHGIVHADLSMANLLLGRRGDRLRAK